MNIFRRLSRKWYNLQNVDECFYFQRKLQIYIGNWPQYDLKNWKFSTSIVLIFIFAFSAKSNFLRKAIIAGDFKIGAIVFPELIITFGFFWVSYLMLSTKKVLKLYLDDFQIEWDLCEI